MTKASPGIRQPVFVLTASRSGSTLLRFILDSHPELACPAETGIGSACAALARVWELLEGTGLRNDQSGPTTLPVSSLNEIRDAIDTAFSGYLRRQGVRRLCDKSLDSHMFADLLRQIYPEAKFLCLYRHCMDVIASGVEACPWGISRFGFDAFVAQHPGNSVAAIGNYWLATAQSIVEFERKNPAACHRVRYEDLVEDPEGTASKIFSFLQVEQVPGISANCFRSHHDGDGPGDEKIWFTSQILSDSIGRGITVPAAAMPPQLRDMVNGMLTELRYRTVDDDWNSFVGGRRDPRLDSARITSCGPMDEGGDSLCALESEQTVQELRARLASGDLAAKQRQAICTWPAIAGETVVLVVESGESHADLAVSFAADGVQSQEPAAVLIADARTWHAVIEGQANLVTEITAGRLRCVNRRGDHRIRSDEVHAIASLLGLARVPVSHMRGERAGLSHVPVWAAGSAPGKEVADAG